MKKDFFLQLAAILTRAAEGEEPTPEDDAIGGLETAKDDATKTEELPALGEGDDLLNLEDNEQAFEPALSPSKWEIEKSGDGYIVFTKTDSKSDPAAAKGRYKKTQNMDTGTPDDAIVDYINAFLLHNKLDASPKSHMTMKTPYGPKTTDKFDNDVSVDRMWQSGKYKAVIRWRPKDKTISVPSQFDKEIELPDELSDKEPAAMPDTTENESIPSLDDLDNMPEEGTGEETEEGSGEEEKPEEEEKKPEEEEKESEEEKPEEEASAKIHLLRLSHQLLKIAKRISADQGELDLGDLGENADEPEDDAEVEENTDEDDDKPEKQDDTGDDEVEEDLPPSADITEIVHNILSKPRDNGTAAFNDYIENEALATGVLYPRDFKDLEKYRKDGELDKLRDKEVAMADRIYGDIDRILKSEAPDETVKKKIGTMAKDELVQIIADNIEQISASDNDRTLSSPVKPGDIANVPDLDENGDEEISEESPPEDERSTVEKLVDEFYKMRGSINPSQRTDMTDMQLLEMARDKLDEENPEESIEEGDFAKAKELISDDLEGRGDLVGNP